MRTKQRLIPAGITLLATTMLLAATLGAQTEVHIRKAAPPGTAHFTEGVVTAQAPTFEFIASEPAFMEKTVTGAPYSAEAVSETTRTLADGTRIKNAQNSKVYRDSEGRIRKEHAFAHLGFWMPEGGESKTRITIVDPVAKKTLILNPDDRSARVLPMPSYATVPDRPLPPPPPGVSSEGNVMIHDSPTEGESVSKTVDGNKVVERRIETHVEVISGDKVRSISAVELGGGAMVLPRTMIFQGMENADNVKVEDLGEQTIQGVVAKGTRRTTTIPTGAIGNDRAIVSVMEEWVSPELQLVVQRTVKDPQAGDTVYRLENLNRAEPLKNLFEVPAGYEVREAAPRMQRIEMRRKRDGE